jgi:hypothetical protein
VSSQAAEEARRPADKRQRAIAVLQHKGRVPIETVCELLQDETGPPSADMAQALAAAIVAKWSTWSAFEQARRRGHGTAHPTQGGSND